MSETPVGWAQVPLDELTRGDSPICYGVLKPGIPDPNGVPMVRVTDIRDNDFDDTEVAYISPDLDQEFARSRIAPGDVLVSVQGTVGRVAIVPPHFRSGNISRTIARIRLSDPNYSNWVRLSLLSPEMQQVIEENTGGTTRDSLNIGDLRQIAIPFAPVSEQHRIVAKIDSLSGKSKRARDHLDHVPRLVENYKKAALGALYKDARNKRPLIELVNQSRGIPYGIIQTGKETEGGIPTVRCGDIKAFDINISGLKRVDPSIEEGYSRTRLRGGEVLLAVRGSVGEVCVASSEMRGFNISREVAMIPVLEYMLPAFVMYFLASPEAQRLINKNVKGVAQQGINLRDVRELPTPVLPISEQAIVVRRIETAFAWIDRLAAEATSARKLIDHLDQAILSKAFRGELVPQDPNDEPASVLLERIRAERAGEAAGSRKRRGRPKNEHLV